MLTPIEQLRDIRSKALTDNDNARAGTLSHDVLNAIARRDGGAIRACALELQYRNDAARDPLPPEESV